LSNTYSFLRRPELALEYAHRGSALDSLALAYRMNAVMACAGLGDLECARREIRSVPDEVGLAATLAFIELNFALVPWVLDESLLRLLVRFGPAPWGDARIDWAFTVSEAYDMLGDRARGRAYADTAIRELRNMKLDVPTFRAWLGPIYARVGLRDSATTAVRQAMTALPVEKNAAEGAFVLHMAAWTYAQLQMPDSAIAVLKKLLSVPSPVTKAQLRVDPRFAPLRGHPGFEALLLGPQLEGRPST
jgi:hypothetical protein